MYRPSGVWANNDVCLGRHFHALPFFFAQAHICFRGIDERPVMLGATCYIASANDGAPCNRLGRVRKKSWEAQPPPSPFKKNLRELHGDNLV